MNNNDMKARLTAVVPDVPETFHVAMQNTLGSIVAQEINRQASEPDKPSRIRKSTRNALVLAFIIVLLLATVALAAFQWHIFDELWVFEGAPSNADSIMKSALHQEVVNNVEITIREAGYDGRSLFLLYSYRMLDVDKCMGTFDLSRQTGDAYGTDGIYEEDWQLLYQHNVGWWIDHIWFDGVSMDMPGGSGGQTMGSEVPGEIVEYQIWRLDNEDVFLDGEVEISLPIGDRHPISYVYDMPREDDVHVPMPEEGLVTFTLDVSDTLSRVVTEHPGFEAVLPELTIRVREVCYTPMLTYIYLDLERNEDVMNAYIAQHGEGYYEDGVLLYPYDGTDIYPWISDMILVDKDGNELFKNHFGGEGFGESMAEFIFPYIENMPDELWLAKRDYENDCADMSRAIRLK